MSSVAISGNASGAGVLTIAAPNTASNFTLTLPAATDTFVGKATTDTLTNKTLTSPTITGAVVSTMASSVITAGTAVASTSGTAILFSSIPSWVKRITVMFNGVTTSASAEIAIQIGSGSITSTGYVSTSSGLSTAVGTSSFTAAFGIRATTATQYGNIVLTNITGNTWTATGALTWSGGQMQVNAGTSPALGGALDRVNITTIAGTATFTAGTINILYE